MPKAQVKLTEFSDLIDRYTADFIGRKWLLKQLDELLHDPNCHFIVITGDPGAGKTAFLAHLAATHPQWLRYFIRRDSQDLLRPGDATSFLLTVGGQLATLYPHLFHSKNLDVVVHQRIGSVESGGNAIGAHIEEWRTSPFHSVALRVEQEILSNAGRASAVEIGRLVSETRQLQMQDLQYLSLLDPAQLLLQEQPDTQIVVLVDALDELRYSPAEPDILRVLREMPEVPSNVCFVVSSRPDVYIGRLLARSDARELPLDVAGPENRADLRNFAENMLPINEVRSVLTEEGLNPEAFVEGLLENAAGNFLYLRSMLTEIREALANPEKRERVHRLLRAKKSPGNLGELYDYFLYSIVDLAERRGFGESAWMKYLSPVLGALAVAQESLTEEHLVAFTGLERATIHNLLRELSQFVDAVDSEPREYHIYHTSFAEHLLDSENNRSYWVHGQQVHSRIVDRYLDSWGGIEAELPGLQDLEKRNLDKGYGLRHLVAHLQGASRREELFHLLTHSPNWMEIKCRSMGGDASYLSDLEITIAEFRDPVTSKELLTLARLYATRSVLSLRGLTYSDDHLRVLVSLGREGEALACARLRPSLEKVFASLIVIYRRLREKDHTNPLLEELFDELTNISMSLPFSFQKSKTLLSLCSVLIDEKHLDEVRRFALDISYPGHRLSLLISLARALAHSGQHDRAVATIQEAQALVFNQEKELSAEERVVGLCDLGVMLFEMEQLEESKQCLLTAGVASSDTIDRSGAFIHIAEALAKVGDKGQAEAYLENVVNSIGHDEYREERLSKAAICAARIGNFTKATSLINDIHRTSHKISSSSESFREIEPQQELVKELARRNQFEEAKKVTGQIHFPGYQVLPLCEIARYLTKAKRTAEAYTCLSRALSNITQLPYILESGVTDSIILASAFAELGYRAKSVAVLDKALQLFYRSHYGSGVLVNVAEMLIELGENKKAEGILNEALTYSLRHWTNENKIALLIIIMQSLARSGLINEAEATFEEITRLSEVISLDYLLEIQAISFSQVKQFTKAFEITRRIKQAAPKLSALMDLSIELINAKNSQFNEAIDEIRQITQGSWWEMYRETIDRISVLVTSIVAETRRIPREIIDIVTSVQSKYKLIGENGTSIANIYASFGYITEAIKVLSGMNEVSHKDAILAISDDLIARHLVDNALQLAHAITDNRTRVSVLTKILEYLSDCNQLDREKHVFELLREFYLKQSPLDQIPIVARIVKILAGSHSIGNVRTAYMDLLNATYATDPSTIIWWVIQPRSDALSQLKDVIVALIESGKSELASMAFPRVLKAARQVAFTPHRAASLGVIAEALKAIGRFDDAKRVLFEAECIIKESVHHDDRNQARRALARSHARMGLFDQALEMAKEIIDDSERDKALKEICGILIEFAKYDMVMIVTSSISDDHIQGRVIGELAMTLTKNGYHDQVLMSIEHIRDERLRASAKSIYVDQLVDAGNLSKAIDIAHTIDFWDRGIQRNALKKVIAALIHNKQIDEALHIVRDSGLERELQRDLVNALSQTDRYCRALSELKHVDNVELLEIFAEWAPAIEKMEARLSISIYQEIARIAGWVMPKDWQELWQIMARIYGHSANANCISTPNIIT